VLAVPFPTDTTIDGVETIHVRPGNHGELTRLALESDAVIAQRLPIATALRLAAAPVTTIYDLYAPTALENLVVESASHDAGFSRTRRANAAALEVALGTGDAFVCASERQRDFWLGALLQGRRITPGMLALDPALRNLIDVVPFGVDAEPPARGEPVLKGARPGIDGADRILLWPGGVWDWTDPLVVIRAASEIARRRDDVRLFFLGTRSPNAGLLRSRALDQARALAAQVDPGGRTVIFNEGWTPFDDRGRYLLEADIGVSAHPDSLETRLAYRSRLLDCVWARLPIVTTAGDVLADLVTERRLGRTVEAGDVGGWVEALEALLESSEPERVALDAVAREMTWERAVEPILRLVERRGHSAALRRAGGPAARYVWRRTLQRHRS
jgi:hypothetical protein